MNLGVATSWRQICLISFLTLWAALTFSSALVEISFVIGLLTWVVWKFLDKSLLKSRLSKPVLIPLGLYLLLAISSYFWSEAQHESFRGIFKISQQLLIFWIVVDAFRESKDVLHFEKIFLIVFWVVLINGACQYFVGQDLIRGFKADESSSGLRLSSSFGSYGLLAAFLVTTLPYMAHLAIQHWKQKANKSFAFYGLAFLLGLALLFFTRSRGAMLAFIMGAFVWIFFRKKLVYLVCAALCLGAAYFFLPREWFFHLDQKMKEQSLVERYYLWDRALNVIKAKPLTGTGINTYATAHGKYDKTQNWRVRDYYAHNGYLQMAAETGIPSLIFFLLFLSNVVRGALASKTGADAKRGPPWGLLIGCLNFLLFAMTDTILHNTKAVFIFWYALGLLGVYGLARYKEVS